MERVFGVGDGEKMSYRKEVVGIEFGEPMRQPGGDPVGGWMGQCASSVRVLSEKCRRKSRMLPVSVETVRSQEPRGKPLGTTYTEGSGQ